MRITGKIKKSKSTYRPEDVNRDSSDTSPIREWKIQARKIPLEERILTYMNKYIVLSSLGLS